MTNLINTVHNADTSSPLRHWLACQSSRTTSSASDDSDGDGGPVLGTFVCYDELNEINMFQVKYKLAPCTTYIASDMTHLHGDILQAARRLCNETLHRSHQHQHQSYNGTVKQSAKAMFKVFPKQIPEPAGNEKVLLTFDEAIASDQLVDVLLNGRCAFDQVQFKWRNRSTLCLTISDNFLKDASQLDISVAINCSTFLGTRTIKCASKPIDCGNLIASLKSTHYLCQSLGAQSVEELDTMLAQVFNESLLDAGIFSSDKTNPSFPTGLHFAARYGFKELTISLLNSPSSARACFVQNCSNARPIDLAIEHGHWDVVQILAGYTNFVLENENGHKHLSTTPASSASILRQHNESLQSGWTGIEATEGKSNGDALEPLPSTCPALPSQCENRIMQAKNELLLLIEKFKCGISIECFEQMFSNWERIYNDVLEGQMSQELQYSLNQIKMLCSLDALNDLDYDDDEEGDGDEDTALDGDYEAGELAAGSYHDDRVHRQQALAAGGSRGALNGQSTWPHNIIATHMDADRNGKQLKPNEHVTSRLMAHCTALHHKDLMLTSPTAAETTTARQVSLSADWGSHLNVFESNANRQFSRDLNSINMSDNEVHPVEPAQGNWRSSSGTRQVEFVSNCQAKCHQFGELVCAASATYMPSRALWRQSATKKESISPPESEGHTNPTGRGHWFADDNNGGDTCGLEPTNGPHSADSVGSALVGSPAGLIEMTNSPASRLCSGSEDKSNQPPPPKPELGQTPGDRVVHRQVQVCQQVDSHGKHDYYQFWHCPSKLAPTKDCPFTGTAAAIVHKKTARQSDSAGRVDRANRSAGTLSASGHRRCQTSSHYYLIPRSIPVSVNSQSATVGSSSSRQASNKLPSNSPN